MTCMINNYDTHNTDFTENVKANIELSWNWEMEKLHIPYTFTAPTVERRDMTEKYTIMGGKVYVYPILHLLLH